MSRRSFNLQLGALLLAWLAAVAVVSWLVLAGRDAALDRGERATAAFATIVDQQVARTVEAVSLTLHAVADAHHLDPRPRKNDPAFQAMMTRRLKDVPFLRALYVIGPDGWILHDTDYPKTPQVPLADRPYFRAYAEDPARAGTTIWAPLLSRSGTGWFLPATYPLGRSPKFEGLVVAAMQAEYFRDQFKSVALPDDYAIALFYEDATLVASYPGEPESVGRQFGRIPAFARHLSPPAGTFWTAETLVPGERVVSYRVVQGTPFVVQVSRSRNDVLAEWRRTAMGAAVAMAALTVLLVWFLARSLRDSARRERERARRAQADKMEALGQLTGGMAHDFANMLNIVALNVELLRAGRGDAAVSEGALATIDRAVRDGTGIVARMLAFARRRPLHAERVRLDEWLRATQPLLAQAAGPRVELSVESESPLPEVLCDAPQLDTAVVNLVVNARDAMAGTGRIIVRAYACDEEGFAAAPGRCVCLSVRDTGHGMTEEVRRRALEPFYTTKGEAGTGLGLSQVYGFMQQLGGSVMLESSPGAGTDVRLLFPVAAAA
jgi:signal transduction histidine kinase